MSQKTEISFWKSTQCSKNKKFLFGNLLNVQKTRNFFLEICSMSQKTEISFWKSIEITKNKKFLFGNLLKTPFSRNFFLEIC
jgi:hypothetical protein